MEPLVIEVPQAAGGRYPIAIGNGILKDVWSQLQRDFPNRRRFVVTDRNVVEAGHLATLLGSHEAPCYVVDPPGEESKTIATAIALVEAMERAYLGRDSLVVALGGGTVGDMAGFAAAIFKRGVPVVQIPTTSLAQADSAVGGKTGVDSSLSKNAFGAFWHPAAVIMDVATLATQDDRQFRSGLVESLKHGLIADAAYFETFERRLPAILDRDPELLMELAASNSRIKGRVVQADPTEKNLRRILNYGHTAGHAIESASGYRLLHGEAVALGIRVAGRLERALGLADDERLQRVGELLSRLQMPAFIPPDIEQDTLIDLIRRDKKAVNRWPRFVLLEQIGRVHRVEDQWAVPVEQTWVEEALAACYESH